MDALEVLDRLELDPSLRGVIGRWLSESRFAADREALVSLVQRTADGDAEARAELLDAFDGPLPIGTGGRRGACGPGTNRMNVAVLRETAEGLANAMKAEGVPMEAAVVFDTRKDSKPFARAVSDQLAACGVNVLLVNEARPTPLLSHIVRARGCGAGVVISASHNPPGDNGIKIYGPDGAQVLGRRDKALMAAITAAMAAPLTSTDEPVGRVTVLEGDAIAEVDDPYLAWVRAQATCGDLSDAALRVAYSPLHGVGESSVVPVLESMGVAVHVVEAQQPDGGAFGTVKSANPESPPALDLGRGLADEVNADLVIANDPDADRVGALAKDGGAWTFIDGNRLAVIMLDHVMRHVEPTPASWVLTTLCTSPLIGSLARERGVEAVDDLLVGFKHHAGMMEEQPKRHLEFATEEAHGYLRGDDVHDKDGAVASVMLSEAAAVAKRQGRTVFDQLRDVWARLGYHKETTANLYALGGVGKEAIATLVETWRADPPRSSAGSPLRRSSTASRARPPAASRGTSPATCSCSSFEPRGPRRVASSFDPAAPSPRPSSTRWHAAPSRRRRSDWRRSRPRSTGSSRPCWAMRGRGLKRS